MSELRYSMFTEKNLSGDRSPSTFDALVLHLRRTLIFFWTILLHLSKIKNIIFKKLSLCIKQFTPSFSFNPLMHKVPKWSDTL